MPWRAWRCGGVIGGVRACLQVRGHAWKCAGMLGGRSGQDGSEWVSLDYRGCARACVGGCIGAGVCGCAQVCGVRGSMGLTCMGSWFLVTFEATFCSNNI